MLTSILSLIKKLIPRPLFALMQGPYHFALSLCGAILYRFPSKKMIVIGVTGTKGKSTTTELINAIFEKAGYKTVLANTIRFKVADESHPNLFKMTMPGRFFIQKLLHEAFQKGCTHAVIEISSEAVLQYRERFLFLDALVLTNLAPEHIESHGSYENYVAAKIKIVNRVIQNGKQRKILVLNGDDPESKKFENKKISETLRYSLKDAESIEEGEKQISFTYENKKYTVPLVGIFNIYNTLAAIVLSQAFNVEENDVETALKNFKGVLGRVQFIDGGQPFDVVVDYAHTPDSLEALYKAFQGRQKICVLSGTGGGRDKWKRPKMGEIADRYCDHIIMTNEDPYDEDPMQIIEDIKKGIKRISPTIILDRREAIKAALQKATKGAVVLLTGKGTDPYIMGPHNSKTPWNEAEVTKEELEKIG